jgi:hypothetical protein
VEYFSIGISPTTADYYILLSQFPIYTVTAEFGPPPPATPQHPHPWPKVISKTFTLLIFGQ